MKALEVAIKKYNEITDTRTKRQWESIIKWLKVGGKATVEAATGFG